ncbi:MAG: metallophosphoesterase [Actinomycetota bacterium]
MAPFTFYFATDVHGSEHCFKKFLKAGSFYGVQAVILGGDVAGKGLVPIVDGPGGTAHATFFGKDLTLEDAAAVADLEARLRVQGLYGYRCSPEEADLLAEGGEHLDAAFEAVIGDSLRRWIAMADERLKEAGIPCLVMPGNDDPPMVKRLLAEASWLEQAEERVVGFGPFEVVSLGYSTPTPWSSPREISEEEMERKLRALVRETTPGAPVLFNLHNPPYDSLVDRAFKLTPDMRIETAGGEPIQVPVGSHAVRTVIEEVQPLLALVGHIHEARGTARIGKTTICNPGSTYQDGILQGTLLSYDGGKLRSQRFVSG